nr:hypothetical protein [Amycolatopsis sp. CM201R]
MSQPARFPFRAADYDEVTVGFTCPNAIIYFELCQPGQGEQQIGDVPRKVVEKGTPVDTIPKGQPDFGVEPGRHIGRDGPRKPKDGNVAGDPGGFPGALGGKGDPAGAGDNAGFIGNGPHGGEPDTEAPDGFAGLAGGPQRGERGDTPGVERSAGVGEPQFVVHKRHPHPPGLPTGHGGIGGVLRKFDEEPIPVGPDPKIAFDVGVFGEPGGRVPPGPQGGFTKPGGPEGIARFRSVADHRSGEPST